MRRFLDASRYFVILAVLGSLLSALALFCYGLFDAVTVIHRSIASGEISSHGAKTLMLYFIEVFDLFLLGTVMLILSYGLYELFIDPEFKLASRMQIHTFEDLKTTLVTVVIAMLAVTFLGQVMTWDGETNLLSIGGPVAFVIVALNIYVWVAKRKMPGPEK